MFKNLIGKNVRIITDWTISLDAVAKIVMIDEVRNKLLLKLDISLINSNRVYEYVVASRRSSDNNIETLITKNYFWCGVTWILKEKFNPKDPFDVSWWRGGPAENATLELIDFKL